MPLISHQTAWDDYLWWQAQDRKILRRVNLLIVDIQRNGNEGLGKPEPLKYVNCDVLRSGHWLRRITDDHRLVHRVAGDEVRIAVCRYHYGA